MPQFRVTVFQHMTTVHTIEADSEDALAEIVADMGSADLAECRTDTLERVCQIQSCEQVQHA